MSIEHDATPQPNPPQRWLERYAGAERINHWLIVLLFMLAGLSGLALFHPMLFGLSALFGGGQWTRIAHPFFGLAMVVGFAGMALRVGRDNRMQARDWQWLRRWRDVLNKREDRLPEVDRYNAGQKLVFWSMAALLAILLLTGFGFWRPWFAGYFPIGWTRVSAALHAAAATLLIIVVIVHAYAGYWVKGSITAMTRGYVSERWAHRFHRLWLQRSTPAPTHDLRDGRAGD